MNDTYLFKMPPELPEEAKEVINHLQSTGTGIPKLRLIAELAKQSKTLEEFLAGVKTSLPEGTWIKVESYIRGKLQEGKLLEALPEASKKEPTPEPTSAPEAPSTLPTASKEEPRREGNRNRR